MHLRAVSDCICIFRLTLGLHLLVFIKLICPRNGSASFQLPMCIKKIPKGFHVIIGASGGQVYQVRSMLHFHSPNPHYESGATRVAGVSEIVLK